MVTFGSPSGATAGAAGHGSAAIPAPVPGVVIAGAGSGTGKTTIATGLMAALARTHRVAPFKVGPDFIDPSYHALATGHPGRNLDSFMCGRDLIGPLYAHGTAGADIAVVEGVMGLFDGRITDDADSSRWAPGSTAEIAGLLGLPVIVVLNARGVSATAGALIHGLATYNPDVTVAGVILNQVGSPRHTEACTRAIADCGIPVVGAIPRLTDVEVPSRHLGLVTAAEHGDKARVAVEHMADLVAEHVDLDELVSLADVAYTGPAWGPAETIAASNYTAPDATEKAHGPAVNQQHAENGTRAEERPRAERRPRIALAGGPAFTFVYAELPEVLAACGADVCDFDPLTDVLPDCDGLIIPGGFPEEHLQPLSKNQQLLQAIHEAATDGMPIYAECAGLLVLCQHLDGVPMAGIVPRDASMSGRLTLGYRVATAATDSVLFHQGDTVRGHEFHHTSLSPVNTTHKGSAGATAWSWHGWKGDLCHEGFVTSNVHASYLHMHPAAIASHIAEFVTACSNFGRRNES